MNSLKRTHCAYKWHSGHIRFPNVQNSTYNQFNYWQVKCIFWAYVMLRSTLIILQGKIDCLGHCQLRNFEKIIRTLRQGSGIAAGFCIPPNKLRVNLNCPNSMCTAGITHLRKTKKCALSCYKSIILAFTAPKHKFLFSLCVPIFSFIAAKENSDFNVKFYQEFNSL